MAVVGSTKKWSGGRKNVWESDSQPTMMGEGIVAGKRGIRLLTD